jgi:hypothetical protein
LILFFLLLLFCHFLNGILLRFYFTNVLIIERETKISPKLCIGSKNLLYNFDE